jgi:hypothetical protein
MRGYADAFAYPVVRAFGRRMIRAGTQQQACTEDQRYYFSFHFYPSDTIL